jgi:hypothetical protein
MARAISPSPVPVSWVWAGDFWRLDFGVLFFGVLIYWCLDLLAS